jgi:AraC-like DNA-binding protein
LTASAHGAGAHLQASANVPRFDVQKDFGAVKSTVVTTRGIDPASRSRHWHEAIAHTSFPHDLEFGNPASFTGELVNWQVGDVSISRLQSQALQYRRLPKHLKPERREEFLVTVPARSEIQFSQCGREVRCNPGGFILERSDEPYVFSHAEQADLWVLKVDASALGARIRQPGRFCSYQFDASNGASALFTDILHIIPRRYGVMTEELCETVGRQLIDLLALALEADERTLTSHGSAVRASHLTRIDSFLRRHLNDPDLDPQKVAAGCGISVRYLHELLRDTNQTLGQWIRDQRLAAARERLRDPGNVDTIAQVAYRFGFCDHAQFSRAFKAQFGITPKDFKMMQGRRN